MKRIISLLLCCVLLAGMLAMPASAATAIDEIEVSIDRPAIGNAPQYHCIINTEGCVEYENEPVMWYDETAGRFMQYGDFFQEGHSYSVQIWISAKSGYEFYVDAYDNIHTTGKINQHSASVRKAYEQIPEKVVELYYKFGTLVSIHTCTPWYVERVEPSCTEDGHEGYYHCECGMNYADGREEQPVDINSWGIIPATGHTPSDWRYTLIAHYKACTTCGDYLGEEEHYGGTANCLEAAKCSVCGNSYGEVDSDHKWSPTWLYKDSTGHAWICADCKIHSDIVPHTPGPAATEKDPQLCKDCGYVIAPAKGHSHKLNKVEQIPATCTEEGNIEYYVCEGCSQRFTDADGKNPLPEGTDVSVGALGHTPSESWSFDEKLHWRNCSVCKAVLPETEMVHDTAEGSCPSCGYEPGSETVALPAEKPTQPAPTPEVGLDTPDQHKDKGGAGIFTTVLLGIVCFAAAITATVIILKKKKK